MEKLDRYFGISELGSSIRTELLAGVTTFLTMAYIIFVQPAVLSGRQFGIETGMDFGAVTTATCVSAAIASFIMGIYGKYPIAQAPGMGENFFFIFSVLPAAAAAGFNQPWRVALGAVFLSGLLFLILTLLGLRELIFNSISNSMKHAIAAGIGLFIAFIGLQNAGLIVKDPGTAVKLNPHFNSPDLLIFVFGLVTITVLQAYRIRGAILWGILLTTTMAAALKIASDSIQSGWLASETFKSSKLVTQFTLANSVVSLPPSLSPTFLKLDIAGALTPQMIPFVIVFLFMFVFDAIGTLVGICQQAGLLVNNKLPRAKQAMISDSVGTIIGAALGTSTVTSFIESAAGVEQGGRTGLTAVVAGALFIFALFFNPIIAMIGSYPPITAPALVFVGALMMKAATHIDWSDITEAIPAFIILLGIPLTYSIADGLALGFVIYPVIKIFAGKTREVNPVTYALSATLLIYFIVVRTKLG